MKLPTIADYGKDHDKLLKAAETLQKEMTAHLDAISDQHEAIGKLYREFDRLKKSLAKATKTEADDQKGIATIERILKDGEGEFKKLATAVAEVKKAKPEAKKLEATAATLVKDLETQVRMLGKRKAPDLGKYETLLRTAKKTQSFIAADLVKHRAKAVDPEREKKTFDKELDKYIADVKAGKHRKSDDDDDWMEGPLEKAKVAAALKSLKAAEGKADKALKQMEAKIAEGIKTREAPDLQSEAKVMKAVMDSLKKIQTAYAKAIKKAPKNAVKQAIKDSDTKADAKKIQALLTQLETSQETLNKRYVRLVGAEAALKQALKKEGAAT